MALPSRSLNAAPTARNSGAALQHVLNWQLPDVPWHLHFRFRFSVTTYIIRGERVEGQDSKWIEPRDTGEEEEQRLQGGTNGVSEEKRQLPHFMIRDCIQSSTICPSLITS